MFVFIIIKENWKSYFLPICMSFYLPFLAYLFDDLNFYIVLSCFFTLASCFMGMVDRDIAKNYYEIIDSQQKVFTSELIDRIAQRKEQKENFTEDPTVVIEIEDGNAKVH
jgi:hypothetical protein